MAFDFAGLFFAPLLRRRESGSVQAISDADVYVYLEDGETAATLYTGRDKETEADNPTAPTSNGNLEFFADPGIYTVEVLIDGVSAFTDLVVVPLDPDNARGEAGTITVGTVEASAPGGDPAVENVGTASEAELNFTFPRGATGDTGATGPAWDGWQGAWVDGDYDANDVVSHEGESWIAPDGASTGDEPGVDAAWEKLAAKGADGEGSVSTVNGDSGPDVVLDHSDVGADEEGTAAAAVSSHEGAGDPHPGYLTEAEGDAAYEALVDRTGASEGEVPTLQGDGTLAFESGSSTAEATAATPDTLALRDAAGRAQFASPGGNADAATKGYADALGTSAATANTIARRDAAGRMRAADPAVAANVATKGYVDAAAVPHLEAHITAGATSIETVTFAAAYSVAPAITVSPIADWSSYANIASHSTTSCSVESRTYDGASVSRKKHVLAMEPT